MFTKRSLLLFSAMALVFRLVVQGGGLLTETINGYSPGVYGGVNDSNGDETGEVYSEATYHADTNGDGKVSILEAYNFARSQDPCPETPFYEDNGAAPAHSGAMPSGGDGALGQTTFL